MVSWLIGIRDFHQEVCWLKYYLALWSNTFPLYFRPPLLTYTLPPSYFPPDFSPMYSTFTHLIACFKNVVARIFRYWHRDLSGHLSYFSVLYPSGLPPLLRPFLSNQLLVSWTLLSHWPVPASMSFSYDFLCSEPILLSWPNTNFQLSQIEKTKIQIWILSLPYPHYVIGDKSFNISKLSLFTYKIEKIIPVPLIINNCAEEQMK